MRGAWPRVAVDHVEARGPGAAAPSGTAELGSTLSLRVRVGTRRTRARTTSRCRRWRAGSDAADAIADAAAFPLKPAGGPDLEGRWIYEGPLALDRTGPFGYTVRVLPAHRLLATHAELGLVARPDGGDGGGRGRADALSPPRAAADMGGARSLVGSGHLHFPASRLVRR